MITARFFDNRTGELRYLRLDWSHPMPILLVPEARPVCCKWEECDKLHPPQLREFYLGHSPLKDSGVYDYFACNG